VKILTKRREYPPYYLGSLAVLCIVYFFTIGSYFNSAPFRWTHNRALGYAISFMLFVGGLLLCQALFDRLYPKLETKPLKKHKTQAPLFLRVVAFVFDLLLSFFIATFLVVLTVGHRTANGFSLSGWRAGLPFVLVFLYFFLMDKYAGGTLAKRLFGIRK
jgi:hypothetical protein